MCQIMTPETAGDYDSDFSGAFRGVFQVLVVKYLWGCSGFQSSGVEAVPGPSRPHGLRECILLILPLQHPSLIQ